MALTHNRNGQGRTWGLHSDNSQLMSQVFQQCNLTNLSGQRLNHATAFFNRAFAHGRNDFTDNLSWFRSLMGLND